MTQQVNPSPSPSVSIITPVFNAERFLEQTIQSVLQQDFTDWELLLVNDCSTDKSVEIISRHKADSRIRLVNLEENSGAAIARNRGISLARGRYIAFLDSDDQWLPDKLGKQLDYMKRNNCAFCFTEIRMTDEQGRPMGKIRAIQEKVDYRYLLRKTVIATSSVVIDKAVVGDFSMPLRRSGQDYATWLMLLRRIPHACCLQEPLVDYRVVNNSLSSNKLSSLKQVFDIQTQDEHIPAWQAAINTCCFAVYAFKKHYC